MQNRIRNIAKRIDKGALKFADKINLMASRSIDISECETVCIALGPRGNLTTLTAAVLSLHPNCQVLNHAGARIYGNSQVDFMSDYSEERFERFVRFAIKISQSHHKKSGGSILYSHAFNPKYKTREIYESTGEGLVKKHIHCLFWKDSHRTTNLIRDKHIDLGNIFKQNDQLRFLQPIRNPMDCAISNLKNTGHMRAFGLSRDSSVIEVTQAILDSIYWFAELQAAFPGRMFYYFEHDITRKMLIDLATFLKLEQNETWLTNALSVMKTKPSYQHDGNLSAFYRDYVTEKFSRFPALLEGLLLFN
jgi:hypothetical protein